MLSEFTVNFVTPSFKIKFVCLTCVEIEIPIYSFRVLLYNFVTFPFSAVAFLRRGQ